MSPYFLFDSLCVAVGRLRPAALLKRWSWLFWLWAHAVSVLGQHRQRKQKGGFFFHRISVVHTKQCLSIDSFLCLWSQISPDMRDNFWSSLFPPPHGVFLKETVDTKKPCSVPPCGVCAPSSVGGVSVHTE